MLFHWKLQCYVMMNYIFTEENVLNILKNITGLICWQSFCQFHKSLNQCLVNVLCLQELDLTIDGCTDDEGSEHEGDQHERRSGTPEIKVNKCHIVISHTQRVCESIKNICKIHPISNLF